MRRRPHATTRVGRQGRDACHGAFELAAFLRVLTRSRGAGPSIRRGAFRHGEILRAPAVHANCSACVGAGR
jgi:hypothetical protein